MERALVIRMHGNPAMGAAIVNGMAANELRRIKAKIAVSKPRLNKELDEKITAHYKRIPLKHHSERYHRFWGYIGLIYLLMKDEGRERSEYCNESQYVFIRRRMDGDC